jgi:hypothetical protein
MQPENAFCILKSPSLDPILSQLNPVYILTSYSEKTYLNNILSTPSLISEFLEYDAVTPSLIRINWGERPSGLSENPDK